MVEGRASAGGLRARWIVVTACAAAIAVLLALIPSPGSGPARAEASSYLSLLPARLMETRSGLNTVDGQFNAIGMRGTQTETPLTVIGRGGVPSGAKAVVVNLAVTGAFEPGFITTWPCGQQRPNASSLNYAAGQTISNAVTVQVGGSGQICIFTFSATHVIIDVTGAYPSTAGFQGLVPSRLLETRPGMNTTDGQFAGVGMREAGSVTELVVRDRAGAGGAGAVVLNVAVTGSFSGGYVTAFPCDDARPNAASLNYDAGQTISNAVTSKVAANGTVCLFVFSATHLIVDLTGAFPAGAGYNALVPARLLETRSGLGTVDGQFNGIGIRDAGTETELVVAGRGGIESVDAVVLNVAVTGSFSPGFLTIFPCGSARPNAASLNFAAGQTISNAVTAKVGASGKICIFVFAATHVIIDVTGFFPGAQIADPTTSAAATTAPPTTAATTTSPPRSEPQFLAVVAVPADGRSRQGVNVEFAIDDEVETVVGWYAGEMGGPRPDFVRDDKGAVRVQVVNLGMKRADVASVDGYRRAAEQIKGLLPGRFVVIFYDGSAPDSGCGVTPSPNEDYLFIAMANCAKYPQLRPFPEGPTLLIAHEIAHALGAVGNCDSTFVNGHEQRSPNDLLYFDGNGYRAPIVLDVGRDDYFGHSNPKCPNIANSPLLTS